MAYTIGSICNEVGDIEKIQFVDFASNLNSK
jgi:hypothetical protein